MTFYANFRRILAFILGAVFFISGLLKLLDPVGNSLVIKEYYAFFNVGFLDFSAKTVGEILALTETLLGTAMMSGVWRKPTAILTFLFLGFFTILTLILLIFNPVMDCGCFGEAIHLTHFQTFIKNLVLLLIAAGAFLPLNRLGKPKARKYVSFGLVSACVAGFAVYSLIYIPVVDFTEFAPGAQLAAAVEYDEDDMEVIFVYEKDGRQESFRLDNLPDSTWTFVSSETVTKGGAGEEAAVLSFSDRYGEYCDAMAAYGPVAVISVYAPDRISHGKAARIAAFVESARETGYMPLVLVAGNASPWEEHLHQVLPDPAAVEELMFCSYYADYKTVITLNRSNGGVTYIHDGFIVCKWDAGNMPSEEKLLKTIRQEATELTVDNATTGNLIMQGLLLLCFAIVLFV